MDVSDLIERLRAGDVTLDTLAPREFEEVVAELLASMGWQVSLTPPSRDSGIDIVGISKDATGFESTWLVECKRYNSDRAVGVSLMRQLYGMKERIRADHALLVTTSSFTKGAAEEARAAGVDVADATAVREWIARYARPANASYASSKQFRSCFVSHSTADAPFVAQLVTRLRGAGVRVWYAPEDLLPGKKIHEEIALAIASFDRLIVVLSEPSMGSRWVQTEIRRARRRELQEGSRVLFPVSLVPFATLKAWEFFDADSGQDLAAEIREYFVPDFSAWTDSTAFEEGVATLLRGLEPGV